MYYLFNIVLNLYLIIYLFVYKSSQGILHKESQKTNNLVTRRLKHHSIVERVFTYIHYSYYTSIELACLPLFL